MSSLDSQPPGRAGSEPRGRAVQLPCGRAGRGHLKGSGWLPSVWVSAPRGGPDGRSGVGNQAVAWAPPRFAVSPQDKPERNPLGDGGGLPPQPGLPRPQEASSRIGRLSACPAIRGRERCCQDRLSSSCTGGGTCEGTGCSTSVGLRSPWAPARPSTRANGRPSTSSQGSGPATPFGSGPADTRKNMGSSRHRAPACVGKACPEQPRRNAHATASKMLALRKRRRDQDFCNCKEAQA